jgi:lipoate-protein ligase A
MRVFDCRLMIDPPQPGPRNMSVDEVLLLAAAEHGLGTLRFYRWSEPTLSLGYFQRYADRCQHEPSRKCAMVRRQTGGGAILHDRELTYSIALPAGHPFARRSQELYTTVHQAFIDVLMSFAAASNIAWSLICHRPESMAVPRDETFLCFERRALGDVLVVDNNVDQEAEGGPGLTGTRTMMGPTSRNAQVHLLGRKILGSAQRRQQGALLQHGSLLLAGSPNAPELAGWHELTGIRLAVDTLIARLTHRLSEILQGQFVGSGFPRELEFKADQLANEKYASPRWTNRR